MNFELRMRNVLLIGMMSLASVLLAEDTASYYATRMIEYMPAPGQFMSEEWAQPGVDYAIGEEGIGVSLGGFGGYIVFGFDRPIVNHPQNPYGVDFLVKGNSFTGGTYGVWTEPGAVQVMQDKNRNGIPDDGEWYELAGSDYYLSTTQHNVTMTYYNPKYDSRYTVPWIMDNGHEGGLITNQFHEHSFYPADAGFPCNYDSLTVTGNMIMGCVNLSNPSYIENHRPQLFGYADNRGFVNMDIDNVVNPYEYKKHIQDGFDLNWAVDKYGQHVELDTVDFVRIYTAINQDGGWLGELSSEILGVGIVKPKADYVPRDYYNNYIGVNRLKAVVGEPIQYEGLLFKNGIPIKEGQPRWWLSTDSVGTIDQNGLFTPTKEGDAVVYFQQCDTVPADSCTLMVVTLNGVVLEMEGHSALSTEETSCFIGERIYITAQSTDNHKNPRYQYDTYTWETTNPEIGTIHDGLFWAKQVGETMLYAYSNTDPMLHDSILVYVKPAVRLVSKADPYIIPYYADTMGTFPKTELIGLEGTNSTIATEIDSIEVLTEGLQLSVKGNQMAYQVSQYGEYQVRIYAHIPLFTASDTVLLATIQYGATNLATPEGYVYIKDKQLVRLTTGNETLISDLQHNETLLAVDGAYAYVASENLLSRINMTTGQVVAQVECDIKAFTIKANMIVVRGKEQSTLLHKTDLTQIKTFPLYESIINIETLAAATEEDTYCINIHTIEMLDTMYVAAIPNNEAPRFKLPDNPQSVTVNEGSELTTNISYSRTKLVDNEGLGYVKLYIRNLQEVQDLIAYKEGGYDKTGANFRFVAGCQRTVDQDTAIYIDLEVIDEWGASTIAPQIKINVKADEVSTDISNPYTLHSPPYTKILYNGQILILHDGIYYDILGNKIITIR